jgi:hypothetical protein
MGLLLLVIGILSLYPFNYVGFAWCGLIIICFGLFMIIYGVIKFEFFCKKDPYSLMPSETQVQNRMLNLLGDNAHPNTISDVTNAVSIMHIRSTDNKQKSIGGEDA